MSDDYYNALADVGGYSQGNVSRNALMQEIMDKSSFGRRFMDDLPMMLQALGPGRAAGPVPRQGIPSITGGATQRQIQSWLYGRGANRGPDPTAHDPHAVSMSSYGLASPITGNDIRLATEPMVQHGYAGRLTTPEMVGRRAGQPVNETPPLSPADVEYLNALMTQGARRQFRVVD